jgi:hypothetical protein
MRLGGVGFIAMLNERTANQYKAQEENKETYSSSRRVACR